MKNPTIAFDEAGNTGQNLLDKKQPIFSLASVNYSIEEVTELCNIFKTNGDELHFVKLKKYAKNRKQFIDFCNHDLISFSKIKYSVNVKSYATIAFMVDLLIEPVYYDYGIDMYQRGMNIAMSNLIYMYSFSIWDSKLINELKNSFVNMIRYKKEEDVFKFYTILENLYFSIKEEDERAVLSPMLESRNQIKEILENLYKYSIDLTYPSFSVLCDWWYRELNQKFDVIHDESKQIRYWKNLIEFTSNSKYMEEREVGFGSRKSIYPLKVNSLVFDDSKKNKNIQIADLVASSVAFLLSELVNKKQSDFSKKLMNTKLFNLKHHSIIPTKKFTPKDLDMEDESGENPLDYFAKMALKSKKEFDAINKNMK